MRFVINMVVSSLVIATGAEISRRSSFFAALLISMPLTSMIALSLVYIESGNTAVVADLSTNILLLVIPSLIFFVALTACLRQGWGYWLAFGMSLTLLVLVYAGYSFTLKKLGFQI